MSLFPYIAIAAVLIFGLALLGICACLAAGRDDERMGRK